MIFITKKQISIRLLDDTFKKLERIRYYYNSKSGLESSFNSVLEKVLRMGIESELMNIDSETRIIERGKRFTAEMSRKHD